MLKFETPLFYLGVIVTVAIVVTAIVLVVRAVA